MEPISDKTETGKGEFKAPLEIILYPDSTPGRWIVGLIDNRNKMVSYIGSKGFRGTVGIIEEFLQGQPEY